MKNTTSPLDRIEKINQHIEKLKQQQIKIQKSFEEKIVKLLRKENAFTHNFDVVYGAIIDITKKLKDAKNHSEYITQCEILGKRSLTKERPNKKVKENEKV